MLGTWFSLHHWWSPPLSAHRHGSETCNDTDFPPLSASLSWLFPVPAMKTRISGAWGTVWRYCQARAGVPTAHGSGSVTACSSATCNYTATLTGGDSCQLLTQELAKLTIIWDYPMLIRRLLTTWLLGYWFSCPLLYMCTDSVAHSAGSATASTGPTLKDYL